MKKKKVTISGKLTIKKYVPAYESISDCEKINGWADSFVVGNDYYSKDDEDDEESEESEEYLCSGDEKEVFYYGGHGSYFYARWEKIDKIEIDGEEIIGHDQWIDRGPLFDEQLNDLYVGLAPRGPYAQIIVYKTAKLDAKVNYEIYMDNEEEFDVKSVKFLTQEFEDDYHDNAMEIAFRGRTFASHDIYDIIENAEYDENWYLERGLEL